MSLKDTLMRDLQEAMRSKDELRKDTIRMARAAIRNVEIDKMKELDDAGVIDVLRKEIKQRRESADEYSRANRTDLVEKELAEAALLDAYLPAQMSEADVEAEIRALLSELGDVGPKDMGKVMPRAMQQLKGRADGGLINRTVSKLLAEGANSAS